MIADDLRDDQKEQGQQTLQLPICFYNLIIMISAHRIRCQIYHRNAAESCLIASSAASTLITVGYSYVDYQLYPGLSVIAICVQRLVRWLLRNIRWTTAAPSPNYLASR